MIRYVSESRNLLKQNQQSNMEKKNSFRWLLIKLWTKSSLLVLPEIYQSYMATYFTYSLLQQSHICEILLQNSTDILKGKLKGQGETLKGQGGTSHPAPSHPAPSGMFIIKCNLKRKWARFSKILNAERNLSYFSLYLTYYLIYAFKIKLLNKKWTKVKKATSGAVFSFLLCSSKLCLNIASKKLFRT